MALYEFIPNSESNIRHTFSKDTKEWCVPSEGRRISFHRSPALAEIVWRFLHFKVLHSDGSPRNDPEGLINDEKYYQMRDKYKEILKKVGVDRKDWHLFIHIEEGLYRWVPETKIVNTALIKKEDIERQLERLSMKLDLDPIVPNVFTDPSIALIRLQTQTRLAALEASILYKHPNDPRLNIELTDKLYVTRQTERKLSDYLRRSSSCLCLVEGEAGNGKTSLLWHIYESLKGEPEQEIWFIRPHVLQIGSRQGIIKPQDLWATARELSLDGNKSLTILFDTVDLLLHDPEETDGFLLLLHHLKTLQLQVVVSSRVQEAYQLHILEPEIFILDRYDENELPEAIAKHAAFFYRKDPNRIVEKEIERINKAVTQGQPVREVCLRPLTLRMLFQLYAPEFVPDEVHIFQLYYDYWVNRVEEDSRIGSQTKHDVKLRKDSKINCAKTTQSIALLMLAEGSTVLENKQVEKAILRFGGMPTDIAILQFRGILVLNQRGYSFFHQTFFEHAAAQGMIRRAGGNAFQILRERIQFQGFDFFVNPILEHALLLADRHTALIREPAIECMISRLDDDLQHQISTAYLYAHLFNPSESLQKRFQDTLKSGEVPVVKRYVEAAVNMPNHRSEFLFFELGLVWHRDEWNLRSAVLRLLTRLSATQTEEIINFYDHFDLNNVCMVKLDSSASILGLENLPDLLFSLLSYKADWGWPHLLSMYEIALSLSTVRHLQTRILKTILIHADKFTRRNLASDFSRAVPQMPDQNGTAFDEMVQAYGALWKYEWKLLAYGSAEIVDGFHEHFVIHHAQLAGLAMIVVDDWSQLSKIFNRYRQVGDEVALARWHRSFWPRILSKLLSDVLQGKGIDQQKEMADYLLELFLASASSSVSPDWATAMSKNLTRHFAESLRLSQLKPEHLAIWFSGREFQKSEIWIQQECFQKLFTLALLGEHDGARLAMIHLRTPDQGTDQTKALAENIYAKGRVQASVTKLAVKLALSRDDINALSYLAKIMIERGQTFSLSQFQKCYQKNLDRLEDKRRYAANKLQVLLLEKGFVPPPTIEDWESRLQEKKSGIVEEVLKMAPFLYSRDKFEWLLSRVGPFVHSEQAVAIEALRAQVSLMLSHLKAGGQLDSRSVSDIVDNALRPFVADTLTICSLGYLIQGLVSVDPDLALDIVIRIYNAPSFHRISNKGRKTIGHRFGIPIGELIWHVNSEVHHQLLDLLTLNVVPDSKGIEENLARPIITKLIFSQDVGVRKHLQRLQVDEKVNPQVRAMLATFHFYHQRPKGSRSWPQLYDLI